MPKKITPKPHSAAIKVRVQKLIFMENSGVFP